MQRYIIQLRLYLLYYLTLNAFMFLRYATYHVYCVAPCYQRVTRIVTGYSVLCSCAMPCCVMLGPYTHAAVCYAVLLHVYAVGLGILKFRYIISVASCCYM